MIWCLEATWGRTYAGNAAATGPIATPFPVCLTPMTSKRVSWGSPCFSFSLRWVVADWKLLRLTEKRNNKKFESICLKESHFDGSQENFYDFKSVRFIDKFISSGYVDIILIPQGATNVVVKEIEPSNNYLGEWCFDRAHRDYHRRSSNEAFDETPAWSLTF